VINGLDHVVVLIEDIKAGAKAYELLLGRAPSWRSQGDGSETCCSPSTTCRSS
jgi:hypothetical protein